MANYRAISNGNWSNLAIWEDNGSGSFSASSSLPSHDDIVYSNNFTVIINQNISVDQLRNDSITGITAGGIFKVDDNNDYTIDVATSMYCYDSITLLELTTNCVDNEITINCPSIRGSLQSWVINCYSTGIVNINGDMWANSYTTGSLYIYNGGVTINHTGNILTRGRDMRAEAVRIFTTLNTSNPVIYNMVGDINEDGSGEATGINIGSLVNLDITGTVSAGTNANRSAVGISTNGLWTCNFTGILKSIGCFRAFWITAGTAGSYLNIHDSTLIWDSLSSYNLIHITDADVLLKLHNVNFDFRNNTFPILSYKIDITHDEVTTWKFTDSSLNEYYMYSSVYGQPSQSDVRDGTLYGASDEFEWTLVVPSPSNVASGVPTDDTVWTADFDLAGIRDRLWVINDWIKKASLLIPHNEDLPED